MKLPATRMEAVRKGTNRYFTGKPCLRGHVAKRYVWMGKCVECDREDRKGKYKDRIRKQERRRRQKIMMLLTQARKKRGVS